MWPEVKAFFLCWISLKSVRGVLIYLSSFWYQMMDDGRPMPKSALSEELSGSDSVKHKSECHSPAYIKEPLLDSLIHRDGPPYQL